jgi:hypothetical protein
VKVSLKWFFLIFTILLLCCKEEVSNKKTETTDKPIEVKKQDTTSADSVSNPQKTVLPKHYEHLFVIAKSGLNYRDSPKGNILGKHPLNTNLKVIEYTKIVDQIKDEEKIVKGEWIGVEKDKDTVYVFNGFLSSDPVISDIRLYYTSPYFKENNGDTRTAFLNLSETYFENTTSVNGSREENIILNNDNLLKDTIRLNLNQRKQFLEKTKISEFDKIYIYEIDTDAIITYNITDLQIAACINIYFSGEHHEKSEFDYEFGFDLGKHYNGRNNFVFIGKNNPFQTGKLKPIIWKKIDSKTFPKKFNSEIIHDDRKIWLEGFEPAESYTFTNENLDYYIQNLTKDGRFKHRYIVVINSKTEKVVFENVQIDSESTSLMPLITENTNDYYENQWTGELFKNKPTIMFGFLSYSFGCPSITVLDETEPAIPILCDNRH